MKKFILLLTFCISANAQSIAPLPFDHILRYDPSAGSVTQAGTLPTPSSDVAVVPVGSVAYVVGGFTGVTPLDTIVAWSPSAGPRVAGEPELDF